MIYRIVQWTTGNVGREMLRVILDRPDFELVGVYAHSPKKLGKDAGEICGRPATGVTATKDVDALLALQPDCVMYAPAIPNVDEMVRILEAGINVVTTSSFFRGHYMGIDGAADRIEDACQRGGVSIFGGGYNPGFVTMLPLVLGSISAHVDAIHMHEEAEIGHYESPAFFQMLGWGKAPKANKTLDRPRISKALDGSLYDALDMIAEAVGWEITERRAHIEYATTPKDIVRPFMTFSAGTVAGQRSRWEYVSNDRVVMSMNITWWIGDELEPNFASANDAGGRHRIEIDGTPSIDMSMHIRRDRGRSPIDSMSDGIIATGANALNAIPAICAAAPGIRSYLDMPPCIGIARTGRVVRPH